MNMLLGNVVLFIIATAGMANLIITGNGPWNILLHFRNWSLKHSPNLLGEIVVCHQCCGFWSGLFCGWAFLTNDPILVFVCGCAGSFVAPWGAIYLNVLESQYDSRMVITDKAEE
jgi:hypothetical protein